MWYQILTHQEVVKKAKSFQLQSNGQECDIGKNRPKQCERLLNWNPRLQSTDKLADCPQYVFCICMVTSTTTKPKLQISLVGRLSANKPHMMIKQNWQNQRVQRGYPPRMYMASLSICEAIECQILAILQQKQSTCRNFRKVCVLRHSWPHL